MSDTCTNHLEWDCREDPPVLGVCLGMWNFLDILHVRFMFIEPSKWPAIKMLGLPCNQRVVPYQKISKIIHLYQCQWKTDRHWQVSFQEVRCHEKLRKACILIEKHRNLFLKTGSNRPKVQLWHAACIKATAFAPVVTTCARTVAKVKGEGLLAYDLHLTHDTSICPVLHSETIRSFVHVQIVHGQLGWRDHLWTPSIHQRVSYPYRPGKCQR